MKLLKILPLICLSILSVGCSNTQSKDDRVKNIELNNIRIEESLFDYSKSKEVSKNLETILYNALSNSADISDSTVVEGVSSDYIQLLNSAMLKIHNSFNIYYAEYKEVALDDEANASEKILSKKEYIDDIIANQSKVYYFMDDKDGRLEQTFVFWLPYGNILRMEFHWLGGVCNDIQIYTN